MDEKELEAINHGILGTDYLNKCRFDLAITELNKAIELNPSLAPAYASRGGAYAKKSQYDSAIADLNRAIELDPSLAMAYYDLGRNVYLNMGKCKLAIANLNKAIELACTPEQAYIAYTGRGLAYGAEEQWNLGIVDLNKAIELAPDQELAYYVRGRIYGTTGQYGLAIADFNKVVQLSSDPDMVDEAKQAIQQMGIQSKPGSSVGQEAETETRLKVEKNWFEKHLNWTILLGLLLGLILVAVIQFLAYPGDTTMTLELIPRVLVGVVAGWVLSKKGYSAAWGLTALIPAVPTVLTIVTICLKNRKG